MVELDGTKSLHPLHFGQDDAIQLSLFQPFQQYVSLLFIEIKLELRKAFTQGLDDAREQIRSHRGMKPIWISPDMGSEKC